MNSFKLIAFYMRYSYVFSVMDFSICSLSFKIPFLHVKAFVGCHNYSDRSKKTKVLYPSYALYSWKRKRYVGHLLKYYIFVLFFSNITHNNNVFE